MASLGPQTPPVLVPSGAPDPLLGRVLDERFRLVALVGQGGMGRVYRGVQLGLDRAVAVKVLAPPGGPERDPGFRARFLREASLTARLRHPNTVTVIDYGRTADDVYYLVMEYLEGRTLADVLRAGEPLGVARALDIGMQVGRSLREAHRAGVVHRDLKPANVMLLDGEAGQDVVKVVDFGLVKSFLADEPDAETTSDGLFLGSPQFMAPEQARNVADPRTDVYGLGLLLYQMLAGRPPFQARAPLDVLVQHASTPPPRFADVRPGLRVPPDVEAVVLRCLEKEPAARFDGMDALLAAMRRAASTRGVADAAPTPTPTPVPADARTTRTGPGVWEAGTQPEADLRPPSTGAIVGWTLAVAATAAAGFAATWWWFAGR